MQTCLPGGHPASGCRAPCGTTVGPPSAPEARPDTVLTPPSATGHSPVPPTQSFLSQRATVPFITLDSRAPRVLGSRPRSTSSTRPAAPGARQRRCSVPVTLNRVPGPALCPQCPPPPPPSRPPPVSQGHLRPGPAGALAPHRVTRPTPLDKHERATGCGVSTSSPSLPAGQRGTAGLRTGQHEEPPHPSLLGTRRLTGPYQLEGHQRLSPGPGGGALPTPSSPADPGLCVCPRACPSLAQNARGPGVRPAHDALRHARAHEGRGSDVLGPSGDEAEPSAPAGSARAP